MFSLNLFFNVVSYFSYEDRLILDVIASIAAMEKRGGGGFRLLGGRREKGAEREGKEDGEKEGEGDEESEAKGVREESKQTRRKRWSTEF